MPDPWRFQLIESACRVENFCCIVETDVGLIEWFQTSLNVDMGRGPHAEYKELLSLGETSATSNDGQLRQV